MKSVIKISLNSSTLKALISFFNVQSWDRSEIRILLSNFTDEWEYAGNDIVIPWNELKRCLVSISKFLRKNHISLEFDNFADNLLKNYLSDRKFIDADNAYLDVTDDEIQNILQEYAFRRELKAHQNRDIKDLLFLKHGANFSVPGAGKTTTLLAVHIILKHFKKIDKLFIISPINAFISWDDEINEIFGKNSINITRITFDLINDFSRIEQNKPDIIIINYEKLRRGIDYLIPIFEKHKIHFVLDESHRIKGGLNNLSFKQIIQLSDLAIRRDILSGTPMPQEYNDLSPQFDFLWGKQIIPDTKSIVDNGSKNILVNESISNKFVRTTKKELGLKAPHILFTNIKMNLIQSQLYELFKSETARILSGMDISSKRLFRHIGKCVIYMMQASTNPMLLGSEDNYCGDELIPIPPGSEVWELLSEFSKYEKPVKIEYLKTKVLKILQEDSSNKVVIWSYFVRNIILLEKIFGEYNPVSIYGQIKAGVDDNDSHREGRIRKFHKDPTCRVMIANPQACGEGISLHKVCHYAIYLDRTFNAAHYLQSVDRIHRLGLDNSVNTYIEILISENTIDETITKRLNSKIESMSQVLNDPSLLKLAYDPEDISPYIEDEFDYQDIEEIKKHIFDK